MNQDFFKNNRQKIAREIDGGVLVLAGYKSLQLSADTAAPFRQEANFWYLSGIEEPDWWIIIEGSKAKTWLVRPKRNNHQDVFDGSLSIEEAGQISGVSNIIEHEQAFDLLRQLARQHQLVYTTQPPEYYIQLGFVLNPAQKELSDMLGRIFNSTQNCYSLLASLRAIKSAEEIRQIEKAIKISIDGYEIVRKKISTFKYEYEIEAELSYSFRAGGANGHAYEPIVASGGNACTLHYVKNNSKLKKGSLILIDAGARLGQYGADISRTYAMGKLTKRQDTIHKELVAAQKQIVALCKPGAAFREFQIESDLVMKETLLKLGLINSHNDEIWRDYFPHSIGHGLGIDTHDSLGSFAVMKPGMVMTIEPGIYIKQENLGARIEDTILITDKKTVNLSKKLSTDS